MISLEFFLTKKKKKKRLAEYTVQEGKQPSPTVNHITKIVFRKHTQIELWSLSWHPLTIAGKIFEMSFGARYCPRGNTGLSWTTENLKKGFASQSFWRHKNHGASLLAKSSHAPSWNLLTDTTDSLLLPSTVLKALNGYIPWNNILIQSKTIMFVIIWRRISRAKIIFFPCLAAYLWNSD